METLQDRLQGLVKESGLSIRALARKIGVSDVSLGHWVSGKYRPKEDGVAAICEFFNVPPAWLLYGDGKRARRAKPRG